MRRPAGFLFSLLLLFCLAACAAGTSSDPAPTPTPSSDVQPTELSFALPRTDSTLHPILGSDRTNLALAPLLWEGLFELDDTFTPRNVLCSSYTVSENGLVWTFALRTDVTFSDGSPLTAAEAAQSLQLAMGADTRYAARLSGVASAAAAGDHSLVVTLTEPNGNLPALLDVPIVKGESEEPLGTGPYVMKSWGKTATLERRTGWWQKKDLPFDSIPLKTVVGADNLIYAFDTHEISLVTTNLTGTNALGYSAGYEAWDCPTSIMVYVGFNAAKGPCSDPLVRQALSRSFDRTTLATALFARHADAAVLPASPASPLYDTTLAAQLGYSTQASADLFAQAGYTLDDGVLKSGSHALTLTFLVNSENTFKAAAADYLVNEMDRLGISVELRKLSFPDYEAALKAGQFDLYLGETMLTADFDPASLIVKSGPLNFGKYASGETDALLAAFQAAGGEARTGAASALYAKLGEDMPFTPLCFKHISVLTQWGQISGLTPTYSNAFYGLSGWQPVSAP